MDEVKEQKTGKQVENEQTSKKEVYQPLKMKVVDVKVEKGYATSDGSSQLPEMGKEEW